MKVIIKVKTEAHNVFTEKVNKIVLSFNDDKGLQSFNRVKSYLYARKNYFKKCRYYQIKMINFNDITREKKTRHHLIWPYVPDHQCRIVIIRGSGLGKSNALLNLTNYQLNIVKIYLYAKDPDKAKHKFLINK